MAEYFALDIIGIAMIVVLILTHEKLRKQESIDAKRLFRISLLVVVCCVIDIMGKIHGMIFVDAPEHGKYLLYALPLVQFSCLKEIFALQVVIGWNLFVDYSTYKSYDHVQKKYKKSLRPCIILSVVFMLLYLPSGHIFEDGRFAVWIMNGFVCACFLMELAYVANAIWIAWSARKRRKPPTFFRMERFLIPLTLGYILAFIPSAVKHNWRDFCLAIAVVFTWLRAEKRDEYMDSVTGFYNEKYLATMNAYMERSGYPNGIGVFFKSAQDRGKLAKALEEIKPADAEIFSIGKDAYLLMAGPQRESVIRLLIKSVRLKAAELDESMEIEVAYAIRKEDESAETFTKRLMELGKEELSLSFPNSKFRWHIRRGLEDK